MENISRAFWKCDFIQFTHKDLNDFNLTDDTKDYLMKIGLPKNHEIFDNRNIRFCNEFKKLKYKGIEYTVIGECGGMICINKMQEVVIIIPDVEKGDVVYVNSNLKYFLLFHQMFYTELKSQKNLDDDEVVGEFGRTMRKKFSEIDPKAMSDEESTWSRMVEQYETCSM